MTSSVADIASEYDLGATSEFEETPKPVTIEGKRFFVARDGDDFVLYSSECPHHGGPVYLLEDLFECPIHGWRFDTKQGARLGDRPGCLNRIEILQRGDRLVALLSPNDLEGAHPDHTVSEEPEVVGAPASADTDPEELDVAPETAVGSVLNAYGRSARRVLADYNMRCLGCALAATESLQEAADTHRLSAEEFQELLARLRNLQGD